MVSNPVFSLAATLASQGDNVMETPKTGEFAHIGKSVIIKGELSGSEDLYVDGVVEGTIELQGNNLVIGPNGKVRANVNAKGVVVEGRLEGNIRASDRAELRKSAVAVGDIFTQRVAVEDGAYFKGKIDIQKEAAKPSAARTEPPAEIKNTASSSAATTAAGASSQGMAGSAVSSTHVTKH
jgi:cytoskeletal protein CcmA (bactofilin family)